MTTLCSVILFAGATMTVEPTADGVAINSLKVLDDPSKGFYCSALTADNEHPISFIVKDGKFILLGED